jgi:glyoxylase-like metal-dependent hydrolase (beta-lactamase superfamily II)
MKRQRLWAAMLPLALTLGTSCTWSATDPAIMIQARQKFFGIENVDANTGAVKKDKVIASWATNTTYVTSLMGRVILLDSYITKPELPTTPIDKRYSPLLPQDLINLQPEAIFLGHGHGDHADNAAYIAKWTNATIYSTPETCDVLQSDVRRMAADPNVQNGGAPYLPNANPLNCVGVVARGSRPGQ